MLAKLHHTGMAPGFSFKSARTLGVLRSPTYASVVPERAGHEIERSMLRRSPGRIQTSNNSSRASRVAVTLPENDVRPVDQARKLISEPCLEGRVAQAGTGALLPDQVDRVLGSHAVQHQGRGRDETGAVQARLTVDQGRTLSATGVHPPRQGEDHVSVDAVDRVVQAHLGLAVQLVENGVALPRVQRDDVLDLWWQHQTVLAAAQPQVVIDL